MTRNNENRARVVNASRSVAIVLAVVWVLFAVTGLSYLATAQIATRPVYVNNTFIGNVELFNLEGGTALNIRFHPVNNDINIVHNYKLNWIQVANRPNSGVYPRVDPPNNIGGYPNKNNPFYYDNWWSNDPNVVNNFRYNGNNYWMYDNPTPGNGIDFETWLTSTVGNNITRLVCFNWGVNSSGGPAFPPNFINDSKFNWNNAVQRSNLPSFWTIATTGGGTEIPTATEWGLMLLTALLIVAGAALMKRARVVEA